jgi:hypothetical protein
MSSTSSRYKVPLQMHTIVDQPLTNVSQGRIFCRVMGMEPINFVWYGPDGSDVQTGASGAEAYGVMPGRYRIVATDAENQRADVTLDVEAMFPSALIVREYRVTSASTSTSRDGTVEAVGQGLEDGWKFLWTHGHETNTPILQDVPCGLYTAMPLPKEGKVPTFIHQCSPARVMASSTDVRQK